MIQRSLTHDLCKWHTKHTLPQDQKVFCTQFRFQCSLRTPGHNYIKTKDTPPTPIVLTLDLGVHWPVPAPDRTFFPCNCCLRARTHLPPAPPPFPLGSSWREAHGTTSEETKRFDGEEDHVQSRRHYGKRRHSKVTCRHQKDVTCKGNILVKATIVILSTYNAQR